MMNGTRLICVDGSFSDLEKSLYAQLPEAGQIYTLRGQGPGLSMAGEKISAVVLRELHNPRIPRPPFTEYAFKLSRFREATPEEVEVAERKACEALAWTA